MMACSLGFRVPNRSAHQIQYLDLNISTDKANANIEERKRITTADKSAD